MVCNLISGALRGGASLGFDRGVASRSLVQRLLTVPRQLLAQLAIPLHGTDDRMQGLRLQLCHKRAGFCSCAEGLNPRLKVGDFAVAGRATGEDARREQDNGGRDHRRDREVSHGATASRARRIRHHAYRLAPTLAVTAIAATAWTQAGSPDVAAAT